MVKLKREVGARALQQAEAVRGTSAGEDGAVGARVLGGAGDVAVEVEVDGGDALDVRGVTDQLLLHGEVGDLGAHGLLPGGDGGVEEGPAAAVLEAGGKGSRNTGGQGSGRRDGKSSLVPCEQSRQGRVVAPREQGGVGVVRRGSGEAGQSENGREVHLYLR